MFWKMLLSIILATICASFVEGQSLPRTTTTGPTYLSGCQSCSPLQHVSVMYATYSIASVNNVTQINETLCTQILSCRAINDYSYSMPIVRYADGNGQRISTEKGLKMSCINGKWYTSDDNKQISNIYDCQNIYTTTSRPSITTTLPRIMTSLGFTRAATTIGSRPFTTTSTPRWGIPFTTTTPIARSVTTTTTSIPTTTVPTLPIMNCNVKGPLFQRYTASADPSASKWGTFVGYFKSRTGCQRLCNQNFQEKCYAYMYEPQNRGTCTIFQKTISNKITENPNSKISIYKKCVKMSPAVSAKCCGTLVQSHTETDYDDGTMTFTYNNNTCRSSATVTCSNPLQQFEYIRAGIMVNHYHFIGEAENNIKFPATCYNGIWQIAQPPLNVTRLECLVTSAL